MLTTETWGKPLVDARNVKATAVDHPDRDGGAIKPQEFRTEATKLLPF